MTLRCTILGCGSSPGVPRINGDWGDCDPKNPKNRRLRCSLLVQRFSGDAVTNVVIDTSPDFRQQMLTNRVTHIDGALYTHPHADHIHGIDDLRGYALVARMRIDTYADAPTFERLNQGFGYCYETPEGSMYPPILEHNPIEAGVPVTIAGKGGPITFLPILQTHGNIDSLGFRMGGDLETPNGGLCYSPDISGVPEASRDLLRDLDIWVVDALQYKRHFSHFSLEETLEWAGRLAAKRVVLTHMHIPLDYETVLHETPDHVQPAHDGLELNL